MHVSVAVGLFSGCRLDPICNTVLIEFFLLSFDYTLPNKSCMLYQTVTITQASKQVLSFDRVLYQTFTVIPSQASKRILSFHRVVYRRYKLYQTVTITPSQASNLTIEIR